MRSFIAIDTSLKIKQHIQQIIDDCKAIQTEGISYSTPEQFHLTLHFLGEIPDTSIEPLSEALGMQLMDTEELIVEKCGAFPDLFFPKVAWIGIKRTPGLLKMYAHIENVLSKIGIAPEKRSFKPHITFARFKKEISRELLDYLKSIRQKEWGAFTPQEFHLYRSELRKEGSLYSKIATFNLRSSS